MKVTLDVLSRGATLAAAFAGIVTLVQFNRGLDFEKDKLAIEMFRDYAKDKREFDSDQAPSEAQTKAFAVTTQYAAETIYRWRRGNPGWEETVKSMIKNNEPALLAVKGWPCKAADHAYICMVQQVLKGKLVCDVAPTCP